MNYYYNVLLSLLAWRLALFRLALQGYLDALLPRASHLAQFACIPSLMLTSTITYQHVDDSALTKIFVKISFSSIYWKCINIKKKFYPYDTKRAKASLAKRNLTYPMSLPGSQGVSMPSLMPIGRKLWAFEDMYTHRQTTSQASFII